MTELYPHASVVNGPDGAAFEPLPLAAQSSADVLQEDDGQISCFCGIDEDDGNTVACDLCNRWQHIRCYYPNQTDGELPADLQHFCMDCKPRLYDNVLPRQNARPKDLKRPSSKGQKKKPNGQLNGQGPPAKRPKTGHRSSNSTTQIKRTELSRMYANDFITTYQNDTMDTRPPPATNLLANLGIGAKMKEWLTDTEEVYRICKMSPPDLFQRYDADMSSIDQQSDLVSVEKISDDRYRLGDGNSPTWKSATLKEGLSTHACIGELRGTVGLKEDYEADTNNKWGVLRHPAPFVFYHPHLPLYVDARAEGTIVRYVRRSCSPNAELRIIITDDSDYHFCFIATRDIEAGEPIAIAWDSARSLTESVAARSSDAFSSSDLESVQQWVSTVLYHCGPCACDRADCWMARFDRRPDIELDLFSRPAKKRKKQVLSPLNTTTNSRSGSEVRKIEDDDSRSASMSTSKESASRDITPNTAYTNGAPELSERERKKLAKEEEMFRRQEADAQGKTSKKKRASGGTKASSPAEKRRNTARQNSRQNTRSAPLPAVKREYVDSSIQCDMDAEEAAQKRQAAAVSKRPRMGIMHSRILQRCLENNERWRKDQEERRAELTRRRAMMPPIITTPEEILTNGVHEKPQLDLKTDQAVLVPPENLLSPPMSMSALPNTPVRKKLSLSEYSKQRKAKESEARVEDKDSSPISLLSAPAASLDEQVLQPVSEDITMEDASVAVNG